MSAKRGIFILAFVSIFVLLSWKIVIATPELGSFITVWDDQIDNHDPTLAYASNHNEYLVVWWNDRAVVDDIYARRVARDGSWLSNFTVVSSAGEEYWQPVIAYSPLQQQYLIAYTHNDPTSGMDVWARRVSWNGGWLSVPIAIDNGAGNQQNPKVAYNSQDDEFLVVYQNNRVLSGDIAAQRVRASDGALLSWANVATGPANDYRLTPDVTYNAARNQYLITYNYWNLTDAPQIRGKLAAANLSGISIAPEINICCYGVSQQQWNPTVAAGPDEYLVAFTNGIISGPIYARRVSGAGTPLGASSGFTVSPPSDCRQPDMAYSSIYGYMVSFHIYETTYLEDVYTNNVLPGQDAVNQFPYGTNGGISTRQKEASVACITDGDCFVVTEDNLDYATWTQKDYEIRGTFLLTHRIYLPLVHTD